MSEEYKAAGVDIDAGNRAVDLIRSRVERTFGNFHGNIISGVGGFAPIAELPNGMCIVLSTDGVGTKLLIAILLNKHGTVGIDLVAMCHNDIAVTGATPGLFLDYIAMGRQVEGRTYEIVNGIADGCDLAGVALIGGEMAEMPGMYATDDYDLAGFAIGFADSRDDLITGEDIRPGMKVYGFASSGPHSNGYSLIRDIFGIDANDPHKAKRILAEHSEGLDYSLGEELLRPTKIYTKIISDLCRIYEVAGMVHITGGGFIDNPPRILPDGCAMRINPDAWTPPPIFKLIQNRSNVGPYDMLRTFNMGMGLLVISPEIIVGGTCVGSIVESDSRVTQFVGGMEKAWTV